MITVACVWVQANVAYTAEYVAKIQSMVDRHSMSSPYKIVCLTDRPHEVPNGVAPIKIKPHAGFPGWWSKIELFNPAHKEIQGRVVYLDLDSIVMKSVEVIARFDAKFAMVPHAGTWKGRNGLRVVPKYNTSVMVWDAKDPRISKLHAMWRPHIASTLWGDQDYVGMMLPNEQTMPAEWFPRVSDVDANPDALKDAVVVLCKKPKNVDAAFTRPWVKENWK